MPVLVKVSQNKNDKTAAFGKWYGRVVSTKTMSYQELCKHMSEHNSVYGEDVCLGVANKLQNCMLEQLLEGKKVQLIGYNSDILGFSHSIEPYLQPKHKKALILGTGGASKAVFCGLEDLGVESTFVQSWL